jgi:hypothetical protein
MEYRLFETLQSSVTAGEAKLYAMDMGPLGTHSRPRAQARMSTNCPRGWFFWGFVPAGKGVDAPLGCTVTGLGVGAGAVTRVIGAAGLTGRACRRLR